MGFQKNALREKQRIVDEYLNDAGRNLFVPAEFLLWLRDREDHPMHGVFFGQPDEDAAMEHRKEAVRRWVSGLRLKVRVEGQPTGKARAVRVSELSVPAMLSPVALRKAGGGYYAVDVKDPAHVDELSRQAAAALESWLERYGGVAEMKGCNVAALNKTVGLLRDNARVSAAA